MSVSRRFWFNSNVLLKTIVTGVVKLNRNIGGRTKLLAKTMFVARIKLCETDLLKKGISNKWYECFECFRWLFFPNFKR